MTFKTLHDEMITAMKARNQPRKEAISGLVAAVKKVAIDAGVREDIPDEMVDSTVLKELKSAQEQLDTCPAEREDLKKEYEYNLEIIKEFAPKQMTEDEIKTIINEKYAEVVATKNRGMIMKNIMPEFKGKADGKLINKIVGDLCK